MPFTLVEYSQFQQWLGHNLAHIYKSNILRKLFYNVEFLDIL